MDPKKVDSKVLSRDEEEEEEEEEETKGSFHLNNLFVPNTGSYFLTTSTYRDVSPFPFMRGGSRIWFSLNFAFWLESREREEWRG